MRYVQATREKMEPRISKQDSDCKGTEKHNAETRDRTGDLQIFSLTLSQLSYRGSGLFLGSLSSVHF